MGSDSKEFRIRTRQIAIDIARATQDGTPWPAAVYEELHGLSGTPAIDAARFATELRAVLSERSDTQRQLSAALDEVERLGAACREDGAALRVLRLAVVRLQRLAGTPWWWPWKLPRACARLVVWIESEVPGLFSVDRYATAAERIMREEHAP